MIFKMYAHEASYFIATMCDPGFAITPIAVGESYTSINSIYVGEADERLE